MNNYIVYYYLREDFSSPFYVGYGKPRRINAKHLRSNGSDLLPPRERRWIVKSGLSKEEAIDLEIKHIALWGRECDGGVLLNQNLGGEGKPGGQKTKGFAGRKHREESKKKTSLKVSGKNNPRAKKYIFISPTGNQYIVEGGVKKFCKEIGITYDSVLGKKSKNTKGWIVMEDTDAN
jgi:hypothetical protein